jgi:NitT/TauT family transport system substrate-binding protein
LFFTLLAALALVLFAACSDDDDESDAGDGTGGTNTSAAGTDASAGETIKLGFSAWSGWFPWQVTDEAGIFDDVGLDVELVYFEGYLDSINALAAGQLDGNAQTLNDTIASVAAGSDQRIVLVNDNSTGNDQIIVTEDIETIEDLAGKTIGVEPGVVDHFLLLLGLESVGMSADDVTIQELETGAAAAAFAAGQLDAVGAFAPFTTVALEREGSHALFDSSDYPGSIPDHLVLSGEFVDSRPDDVQKLIEAWFLTLEYIDANQDESVGIMSDLAGVTVEEYASYDAGTTIFSLDDNLATFEEGDDYSSLQFAAREISTFLVEAGFIEAAPDLTALLDPTFVQAYADSQ